MTANPLKRVWWLVSFISILTITDVVHAADDNAQKILRALEQKLYHAAADVYILYDMIVNEPNGTARKMQFSASTKDNTVRRLDMLGPGEIRGTKILIYSASKMYIYLPAYKRVRRVAGHLSKQKLFGSSIGYEDMSITEYSKHLTVTLTDESTSHWTIYGKKLPGSDFSFPAVEITIRKDLNLASQMKYFNEDGQLVKTEYRLNYACKKNYCSPGVLRYIDHTRGDLETILKEKRFKHKPDFPSNYFSIRDLKRTYSQPFDLLQ
jgi:hypothetical protein